MSEEKPTSPKDPRPNNEPYYIESKCPECGTPLKLEAELKDCTYKIWYDEWRCPNEDCEEDGVFMDVPERFWEKIYGEEKQTFISLDSI